MHTQLIYNIGYAVGVLYGHSAISISVCVLLCVFFPRFFPFLIDYYKVLSVVPCTLQQVFVGYLFYILQCVYVNPILLIQSPNPSPSVPFDSYEFVSYVCGSISVLYISSFVSSFQTLAFSVVPFSSSPVPASLQPWKLQRGLSQH